MNKRKRFIITGGCTYGVDNHGDDAMLSCLVRGLKKKYKNPEIIFLARHPNKKFDNLYGKGPSKSIGRIKKNVVAYGIGLIQKFLSHNNESIDFIHIWKNGINNDDEIIIAPILGFTILGNYQLGIQFVSVMTIIPLMIFNYTLPNDSTGNSNILIKKIIIIVSVVLAILAIVLAPIVLPHIFPEFENAIEIIQIMSISVIPITIIMNYVSKFLGSGNSKIVIVGTGIYVGIQIPTILLLTDLFGVNGTASSVVIANAGHAIYFVLIDRFTKILKQN